MEISGAGLSDDGVRVGKGIGHLAGALQGKGGWTVTGAAREVNLHIAVQELDPVDGRRNGSSAVSFPGKGDIIYAEGVTRA